MKSSLILLCALFFAPIVFANKIDSLKTDADVLAFLKTVSEDFRSQKLNPIEVRSTETIRKELNCNGIADKWQVKNWEKADFNSDGHTDLLVILYWYNYGIYAVIDKGNEQYELETLSYNVYQKCNLAKSLLVNGKQLLLYYQEFQPDTRKKMAERIDTLLFNHGGFVEMNGITSQEAIDSVEFRTGYCYGSCPVFTVHIAKDGQAEFISGTYNPRQGQFKAMLANSVLSDIYSLISYLNVKRLSDDYSVPWTDDQTCWLRVKFSNGSVKEIRDYGLRGSFGLRLLYKKFFDLRGNQDWK